LFFGCHKTLGATFLARRYISSCYNSAEDP
jgi:hypothetical protein